MNTAVKVILGVVAVAGIAATVYVIHAKRKTKKASAESGAKIDAAAKRGKDLSGAMTAAMDKDFENVKSQIKK